MRDKDWIPSSGTRIGATRFVRQDFPWLHHYFGGKPLRSTLSPGIGGIVLWGGRVPAQMARAVARLRGIPFWNLEDGFLRSVGLGKEKSLPISISIDDLGMAVNAFAPSRLERLIAGAAGGPEGDFGRAIREAIIANRLSKYNNLPHRTVAFERTGKRRILLVDQVFGDVSVPSAGGSPAAFDRMLADAVASGAQCIVRTHPDVMAGFRKGYMTEKAAAMPGVLLHAEPVSAASILDVVDEVWTMSSQFGLDALLRGLPVRCYAAPFYSGWGLTDDRFDEPVRSVVATRRQARPSLDQLVAAAFGHFPIYRETTGWREIDVFQAIETLAAERARLGID